MESTQPEPDSPQEHPAQEPLDAGRYQTADNFKPVVDHDTDPTIQDFPQTERLGLPLIPDDADAWGDEYRHTMQVLDEHPGIRTVDALPPDPWPGMVVSLGNELHKWTPETEWEVVGLSAEDSRALEAARALLASIDVRLASLDAKDYATQATLAQAAATIQDLLDRVGTPSIAGDTVLRALRDIHQAVDGLELSLSLTADTLNLNTDDLEALLREISGKVLTVQQLRGEPLRTAALDTTFVWGEAIQVAPGATQPVATLLGSDRLRAVGFSATGEGDATFRLLIDGRPVATGHINVTSQHLVLSLPVSLPVRSGATAQVVVAARGEGVSDFEATIYGEITHG